MPSSGYLAIAAFPFFFAAIWLAVTWFVSLGGWNRLSKHFQLSAADGEAPTTSFGMQSARLRNVGSIGPGMNYRGALTIGCQPAGLRLSVMFLFRFNHPPLLIPWSAIGRIEQKSALFGLSQYYNCLISLPDGSEGVEMQITDQRIVETITSYQQVARLGS